MTAARTGRKQPSIRTLWAIAKSPELHLTDEDLHAVVYRETGKESMKMLTQGEVNTVARVLQNMKDSVSRSVRDKRTDTGGDIRTTAQRRKIYALCEALGWNDDPRRIQGFVKRVAHVDRIEWLNILYNKCEWFRNAVNSVINFFKETLTAVGSVAKSVFEGIGNVIGSVMDAAKATVSEKLSNIKTAYEEHGGGISGVAAAAMEAVKGWYTAGYTFIDNLTGGKLSEIREKFSTAMSNIVQGISQKFTDARTAFSNGLNNIKNAVSGAVTWFFESGKRIVSTFANGIKSAFSSAVEAVKGGLQKIRNLLPFSDAKEGPLSTLTLSGQRTMTTYAHGLTLAGDAPAAAMNKSLQQVQGALDRKPEKKVDLGGGKKDKDESSDEGSSGKGKQVIIHKLLVPVDLKKIKDLQQLLALLQEVEDYAAANEDGEPGDDEDAAPAPA